MSAFALLAGFLPVALAAADSPAAPMNVEPLAAKSTAPAAAGVRLAPVALFQAAAPSVVQINTFSADGAPLGLGSGFYLDGNTLVTNAHVVAGAARMEVVDAAGSRQISRVLAFDAAADLAALEARGPALRLAATTPAIGEHIFVIGNPQGLTQTFSDGLVSAVREMAGTQLIQISAPISPGSSGGPVFDAQGRVLGVATMAVVGGQNLNFAVSAAQVAKMLKRPRPLPLAEAGAALAADKDAGRFTRGTGRVEIINVEPPAAFGDLEVSLANHDEYPVAGVVIRVLYYSDPAKQAQDELQQLERTRERAPISRPAMLGNPDRIRKEISEKESYLKVLERDPSTWLPSDLAFFPPYNVVTTDAQSALRVPTRDAREYVLSGLRAEIPQEKVRVRDELETLRSRLRAAEQFDAQMAAQQAEADRAAEKKRAGLAEAQNAPRRLLDYKDHVLEIAIDPNLARTIRVPVQNHRGWTYELKVLDYVVAKP